MNPHRFAIIVFLAVALLLAAAGALHLQDAAAQTPTTWDDMAGTLTLTPPTVTGSSANKCGTWPAGSPYVMEFLNQSFGLYGVCTSVSRTFHPTETGHCEDDNDCRPAHYTYTVRYSVHFDRDADFRDGDVPRLGRVTWIGGSYTIPGVAPADSVLNGQDTLRVQDSSARTSSSTTYNRVLNQSLGANTTAEIRFTAPTSVTAPSTAPATPFSLTAVRNASYDAVELGWELYDYASKYEIERLTATAVSSGQATIIEYGDPERFNIDGTISGVDSYTDDTAEANRTYRYRIRAQGEVDKWSAWTSYIFTGAKPEAADLGAPANLRLDRTDDNSSVTVEWSAPGGDFDHYTLQRQQLVVQDSSTFFANAITLGSPWLPTSSLEYRDTAILPGQTYEYRVAAVKDDLVGEYTDWARSSPVDKHLGPAPDNLQIESDSGYRFRREVWLGWDEVDGADDYEVGVLKSELTTGLETLESLVYTDNSYFHTGFSRAAVRVRARKHDDDLCGAGTNDYCYTAWTGWLPLGFTPVFEVESPDGVLNPPASDADVTKLRANFVSVLEAAFAPIGLAVATDVLLNLGVLFVAAIPAGLAAWRGRLTGMLGIGLGDGVAYFIMTLALGVRLLQLPESWLIGALSLVLVGGGLAMAKSFGVLGRS